MGADGKFDAIVVGAGPAGVSAAITMARGGLEVAIFEKGRYPGTKNLYGGILFTPVLEKLVPDFVSEAPLERHIIHRKFSLLSSDAELSLDFRTSRWNEPPHNHMFTAFRGSFDRWFAEVAERDGAFLVTETVVVEFLYQNGRIVGVRTDRPDGDLRADLVILAEGANTLLAEAAGLKPKPRPEDFIVAVKETMALPQEVIDDRFHLAGNEGAALEYFGEGVRGMLGSGFIYTCKQHLSLGIGYSIASGIRDRLRPHDVLVHFKQHPAIRPLIRGAETVEYGAHMIPEAGIRGVEAARIVADGLMIVGDAASLVNTNPLYHEGTNLAMQSGILAGEVALQAHERGDFSETTLQEYERHMKESWVWKDLEEYRHLTDFFTENGRILREYPEIILAAIHQIFKMDGSPKQDLERKAVEQIGQILDPEELARVVETFKDQPLVDKLVAEFKERIGLLGGLRLGWRLLRG
ncbi:MAG: FAD-dependent monooxygenase [Candidatus Bipolaricaulia bacterium]